MYVHVFPLSVHVYVWETHSLHIHTYIFGIYIHIYFLLSLLYNESNSLHIHTYLAYTYIYFLLSLLYNESKYACTYVHCVLLSYLWFIVLQMLGLWPHSSLAIVISPLLSSSLQSSWKDILLNYYNPSLLRLRICVVTNTQCIVCHKNNRLRMWVTS